MKMKTSDWLVAVVLLCSTPIWAVTSRVHRQSGGADLLKGDVNDVIVSSRGTLRLARSTEVVLKDLDKAWSINSIVSSGGVLYLGTSPNGGIYRYAYGQLTPLYPTKDNPSRAYDPTGDYTNEHVFAMTVDVANRLLAGISGSECKLVRFSETGGMETLFEPEDASYIFALETDEAGNIYVATGPEGRVYRVDSLGRTSQLVYHGRDKNILSLQWSDDGFLYAGGDGRGLIYKLNPRNGSASVLYDSDQPEISALLLSTQTVDGQRQLYACGTSARLVETEKEFAEQSPQPGRPEKDAESEPEPEPMDGTRSLKIANTQKEESAPQRSPARIVSSQKKGRPSSASSLYRINKEGYVTEVAHENAVFFCMTQLDDAVLIGTGNSGRLLSVDMAQEQKTVVYEDPQASQITTLALVQNDLYLGTANPAKLVKLNRTYSAEGTYVSGLVDAGQPANWGKLQIDADIPAECSILMSCRSGNVEDVNDPTFSDWTKPMEVDGPVQLGCPLGRFCQYRLTLKTTDPAQTPLIREIAVASTIPNLAPVVQSIDVKAVDSATRQGLFKIRYDVLDRNDDELVYSIYFRKLGRSQWIILKENLEEEDYEWDSRTVEDGRYEFRVVASDERSNSADTVLTGSRVSDAVVIDNTGPVIRGHFMESQHGLTTLGIMVTDELTAIGRLDYTVDGNTEWRHTVPDDLVYDTTSENFTLEVQDLKAGEHILTVRVRDDLHNTTYHSFEVFLTPEQVKSR